MGNETSSNNKDNADASRPRRPSETISALSVLSIQSRSNKFANSSSMLTARISVSPATRRTTTTCTGSSGQLNKIPETCTSPLSPTSPLPPTSPLSPSSPFSPSTNSVRSRSKATHNKRRSSLLNVHNGITGKYISSRICKIAAKFWQQHINSLSVSEQLEIGCSIFFSMLASNSEMKKIMRVSSSKENSKIEKTSLKYLDMMGWLIRHLVTDNINLYALLTKLGTIHRQFGVHLKHFNPMLQSMHETFSYYFETTYNIEIKYAMDEIFSLAAQVMTGQELKFDSHLNNITQQFKGKDIPFLKDLKTCLKSSIGREYLYRYLAQTWCDEIAIFLKAIFRFKNLLSDKERFMVARQINKSSIHPTATFCLNLSYEHRMAAMNKMAAMNAKFLTKDKIEVKTDFFIHIERETYRLIMDNHWKKFVEGIEDLQEKSANVE